MKWRDAKAARGNRIYNKNSDRVLQGAITFYDSFDEAQIVKLLPEGKSESKRVPIDTVDEALDELELNNDQWGE